VGKQRLQITSQQETDEEKRSRGEKSQCGGGRRENKKKVTCKAFDYRQIPRIKSLKEKKAMQLKRGERGGKLRAARSGGTVVLLHCVHPSAAKRTENVVRRLALQKKTGETAGEDGPVFS